MSTARITVLAYLLGAFFVAGVKAQEPANLQEAEALSAQSGKPLLIEFFWQG